MDENENEIARIGPPRPPLLGGACTVVATPTCQRPILETDALRLAPPAKRLACLANPNYCLSPMMAAQGRITPAMDGITY